MKKDIICEMISLARFSSAIVATRVITFAQGFLVILILNHYSAVEMGGVTLALAIGQILIVLGFTLLIGIETEIARWHGAGDKHQISEFLVSAFFFASLVGVALGFLSTIIVSLLSEFGENFGRSYAESLSVALPAVKVIGYGLPAHCVYLTASYYFEATRNPRIVTILSLLGLGVGVAFAIVLIPDRLGNGFSNGIGAAWALTLARMAQGTVALTCVLVYERSSLKFRLHIFHKRVSDDIKKLLVIGVPMTVADCSTTIAVSGMTFLVGGLGTSALNIYQISSHFLALLMLIGTGVASSITIRVTNAIGANDRVLEAISIRGGVLLFIAIDTIVLSTYVLFPLAWSNLYSASSQVSVFIVANQIWAILVFFIECPLNLIIGIGRARGMTTRLPAIKAVCFVSIAFPLSYVITHFVENPMPYLLFGLIPTLIVALAVALWQIGLIRASFFGFGNTT